MLLERAYKGLYVSVKKTKGNTITLILKYMNRYDLSKEGNDSIAQAIGAAVAVVATVVIKEWLNSRS